MTLSSNDWLWTEPPTFRHVPTGVLAVGESWSRYSDRPLEITLRFAGDPRTDDWGPFVEAVGSAVRDLERIVIQWPSSDWERA